MLLVESFVPAATRSQHARPHKLTGDATPGHRNTSLCRSDILTMRLKAATTFRKCPTLACVSQRDGGAAFCPDMTRWIQTQANVPLNKT